MNVRSLLPAARLSIKQHAFEVVSATVLSLVVGVVALLIAYHFASLGTPAGCLETWLTSSAPASECGPYMREFQRINEEEASPIFGAMIFLPFIAGIVVGVPIVGRELESRTAHTAWWLEPSRSRWLARQIVAPCILLGVSIGFAAAAASILQSMRELFSPAGAEAVSVIGWPVLFRGAAALGIGLFLGSLLGRVLPALVLGAAMSFAIAAATGSIQAQWLYGQVEPVVDDANWHGHAYGVAYISPGGETFSETDAVALAPADSPNPYDWLAVQGYREVPIGVSDSVALTWAPYDIAIFGGAAIVSLLGSFIVVSRRRPQ